MTLNDLERRNSPYFAFFSRNLTDFPADYTLMTLNDLERRNSPYFAFFSRNLTDFPADYITG